MNRGSFGFDRGPMREIGVEDDLEVGSQRRELGTQAGHLVGGLRPNLRRQLAAEMGLDGQFVFATRRNLTVEL